MSDTLRLGRHHIPLGRRVRRWDWLESLIKENGWTFGAELGVLKGDTYLRLLKSCPELMLVGVDLWAPQPNTPGQEDKIDRDFVGMLENIYKRAPHRRAILVRDWTVKAADRFRDGVFDFVFVDADHSSEAVEADILAWRPKLKPDGEMLGHDINWPSVRRVVEELYPNYTTHPDNCWRGNG